MNEVKIINQLEDVLELRMADEDVIVAAGGCPGYMSPIGIKEGVKIFVDATVMEMYNACAGANEKDVHYINVNPKRDFKDVIVSDIRMVQADDVCPHCGGTLKMTRGIEAGQVFTLGTKYSEAMHATFLDENGKEKPFQMGCYGIGVGRTMAAAIEQNNDENGIIWPKAIAPFEVVVVPVNAKNADQLKIAEDIYNELKKQGVDALLDDRKDRAGVKFKDADLIGYPLRITVGPKAVDEDSVELKIRRNGDMTVTTREEAAAKAVELLAAL